MQTQFTAACAEVGFYDEGDGTFSCDEQGMIVLYINDDQTAVYVVAGKTHCFSGVAEAIAFAQSKI